MTITLDKDPAPTSLGSSLDPSLDHGTDQLMQQVGQRVRAARERKGIPRRILSEQSGVSPRYLAQLEAGEGNISIALLQRVALALGHRIEWFVGVDDPWTSDAVRMAEQFRQADSATRASVMTALGLEQPLAQRAQRICLIGLRGAGKSTLGQAISQKTELPFVELNEQIERDAGMPIGEIMALYGQEGYRRLEASALDQIIGQNNQIVLAVAGGIVAEPPTYNLLLSRFHTIWLKASPEEHMDRVLKQGDTRPMAGNPKAMAQLRSILTSREASYAQADASLNTSGLTVEAATGALDALIAERGYLA